MKKGFRFYALFGALISSLAFSPVCAFADDGYSVQYFDSEADYFANSGGSSFSNSYNDSYSSGNYYDYSTDYTDYSTETLYNGNYTDTIQTESYGDYTIDGYYENGTSTLGSDIVYGSSSTPTTRLWSDEPLVNTVTANQHRVRNEKKPITIKINGEKYTPRDTQPLLIDGRVFVPLRFVVEQLGYTVSWDSEEMIAEINDGAIVVEVGSYTMWKYDGMTIPTDVPPFLYQGTLMVGLRQIGNALNYKVGWDEENRVVSLDRAKPNYDLKQHNVFDRSVY
ncbi:copper amine oxidase N-terminal domain-containing protein [Anaerotignum sp.]|nr:copper amine oxidase N-terminal domain-containing protein [Anaerotignum sp.]MBQ7759397.1 copper amine oxidase N-terminal domain-containing protein [Anaerotignum sp.]